VRNYIVRWGLTREAYQRAPDQPWTLEVTTPAECAGDAIAATRKRAEAHAQRDGIVPPTAIRALGAWPAEEQLTFLGRPTGRP
jgi:hypothetical protein